MPIHYINMFSNKINRAKVNPEIYLDDRKISLFASEIDICGKVYPLNERVDINVAHVNEKSYIKIYFVEDLLTNELLVVTDVFSEASKIWQPDFSRYRILFSLASGTLNSGSDSLENGSDITFFLLDYPKE